MDGDLHGKVCLATGASPGIGQAAAVMLAAEGAQVVGEVRGLTKTGAEPFIYLTAAASQTDLATPYHAPSDKG